MRDRSSANVAVSLVCTATCCRFGSLSLLSCEFLVDQTEKLFKLAAAWDDVQHRQTHLGNMVKHLVAYRHRYSPQELVEDQDLQ